MENRLAIYVELWETPLVATYSSHVFDECRNSLEGVAKDYLQYISLTPHSVMRYQAHQSIVIN